ncbi:autotransporter outer membrane beta-barrel domain-containing protein, partial [Brucellaceae bacterium C25G]
MKYQLDNKIFITHLNYQSLTRKALFTTVSLTALLMGAQGTLAQQVRANGETIEASGTVDTGTATGSAGYGLYAVSNGIITSSTPLTVITGGNSTNAVHAERGGQITIAAGSTITANGGGSSAGIFAQGTGTGSIPSTVTATDTVITSNGTYAVAAREGGVVNLVGGSVTNTTNNGLYAWTAFDMNPASTINATDVAVTVTGAAGRVVYGAQANIRGNIHLNGGSVTTTGTTGHGIGTAGTDSVLTAEGTSVTTSGASSIGAYTLGGNMTLKDVTITTAGSNAHGAVVQNSGQLDVSGSSFATSGNGASALHAGTSIPNTIDENTNTATIADSVLISQNGAGVSTNGTTLNASLTNSSLSGNSALLQTIDGGALNLTADNSVLTGAVITQSSSGSTTNLTLSNDTLWNVTGNSNVTDLVNAESTINIASPTGDQTLASSYKTLSASGDYTSNEGTLKLNTHLGDDNSATDKLVIDGVVTGTTYVVVNNTNGSGAQTLEGIELITTGGSDADAFVQDGRIVAGSYDYSLQQGNASGNNLNNWYLTSE